MGKSSARIAFATAVCGTLDIVYGIGTAMLAGGTATGILRFVAQGPFGDGVPASPLGASIIGLAVHYSIMAIMAAVFLFLLRFPQFAKLSPWVQGIGYGLLLYGIMYWLVMPIRWPHIFPQFGLSGIAQALFPHIALVGLPFAFIFRSPWHPQTI